MKPPGLVEGLRADAVENLGRPVGRFGITTMAIRLFTNPQLRACALVRLTASGPRGTRWFWRNLLVAFHTSDVEPGAIFSPGLRLPHPFGIVFGANARIGSRVSIGPNVTIGPRTLDGDDSDEPCVIEDEVKIFGASTVVAGVTVGRGAVIGGNALVSAHVQPGGLVRALTHHDGLDPR